MPREPSRLCSKQQNERPLTRSRRAQLAHSRTNQYQYINSALETLDNDHAFMFLKTFSELNQEFLCKRAQLAHQLGQHEFCLPFARQALVVYPTCKGCLQVYLSHGQNIPTEDLPLSQQLMRAIEEAGADFVAMIPKLVRRSKDSQQYQNLIETLKSEGSQMDKLALMQCNWGRKVISTSKIQKSEQILFVPNSQLITLQLSRTLPLVNKLITHKVPLRSPKHTQLSIFLLEHMELGTQSPFWSYLSTLPKDFKHFPVNYSEELMRELKGTCFLEQVQHKRADMRKDYQVVVAFDQRFARFTFERFCEARLLVSSRVFGIMVEQTKTDALVPVADMLNHRLPKQTSWFYCDRLEGFVIQALREIGPGAQVFDSYGQKCNSRFLLNYGFVLPNNMHNEVVFDVDLGEIFEGAPRVVKIRVGRFLDSRGFEQMMGLLRATVVVRNGPRDQDEQQQITMGLEAIKQTPFKSKQNELLVWRTIESLVTDKLCDYPTTIIEDKRLLQTCRDGNLSNVLILRKGEKEVLLFYQVMSRRMANYFQKGSRAQIEHYQPYLDSIANGEGL